MTSQLRRLPQGPTLPAGDGSPGPAALSAQLSTLDSGGVNWQRVRSALLRFWWLVLGTTVIGGGIGIMLARQIKPQYQAFATIWINVDSPQSHMSGPIRGEGLLSSNSWPELLTSFAILDSVARKMRLYVVPEEDAPPGLFSNFDIGEQFIPGHYDVRLTQNGSRYQLLDSHSVVREQGSVGDSIGRSRGFKWAPSRQAFAGREHVSFWLTTPREAAGALRAHMAMNSSRESSILPVMLTGRDPEKTAATLRSIVTEFERTAARLKTRNLVEFAKTLEDQLSYAAEQLREAEIALETFRVRTITLPSEGGSVVAGLEVTRDPVLRHFFDQRLQLDSIQNDATALSDVLRAMAAHRATPQTLLSIPSVHSAPELTSAITELSTKQAEVRAAGEMYTEENRRIIDLRSGIQRLEFEVIPAMATNLLDRMRRHQQDLSGRVEGASRELRQIPTRTIEEMRLRRNVEARLALYTTLKSRYEEARLAQASSLPDMSVLDYPVVPQRPARSDGVRLAGLAILFSLCFGLALAILLDYLDKRFRYPEQATHELGLDIVGVVPKLRSTGSSTARAEQTWQLLEAFRTLRLSLSQTKGAEGLLLTVTSPGSGDGKSFISSNLALSCVSAGYRTVLVDGDVHRGALHQLFDVADQPGLADYLNGTASLPDVLRQAAGGLTVISAGKRGRHTAELLASPRMIQAMTALKGSFDVVIVDSPPLCAGIDSLVLATQTTNLVIVLRNGQSDRRLADAKLRLVDRLPIRVLGAVLNGVSGNGSYRYYGYYYGGADHSIAGDFPAFREKVVTS